MPFSSNGKNIAQVVKAVALMYAKARTNAELSRAMEIDPKHPTTMRYIEAMRANGLLYILEWPYPHSPRYAWQPAGERIADAPKPLRRPRYNLD